MVHEGGQQELLRRMRGAQGKGASRDASLDHIHQSTWILSSEQLLHLGAFILIF